MRQEVWKIAARSTHRIFVGLGMLVFMLYASTLVLAQPAESDEKIPEGTVPPPIIRLSSDEAKLLEKETNASERTKIALRFLETRLSTTEREFEKEEFDSGLKNLGGFSAVMHNALKFLEMRKTQKGISGSFKKLEIGLRGFINRLEILRRNSPLTYEYHIRQLIKDVKKSRDIAIEPLFGEIVPSDKKKN